MSAGKYTYPAPYTMVSELDEFRSSVASDVQTLTSKTPGWQLVLQPRSRTTANFVIYVVPMPSPEPYPSPIDNTIAQRIRESDAALRETLRWASNSLPSFTTTNAKLSEFYDRSLFSLVNSRWFASRCGLLDLMVCYRTRSNFFIQPFYAVGTWLYSVLWDTSYASEILALLEPQSLRKTLVAFASQDLMKACIALRSALFTPRLQCTYIPWNGKTDCPAWQWYAQVSIFRSDTQCSIVYLLSVRLRSLT